MGVNSGNYDPLGHVVAIESGKKNRQDQRKKKAQRNLERGRNSGPLLTPTAVQQARTLIPVEVHTAPTKESKQRYERKQNRGGFFTIAVGIGLCAAGAAVGVILSRINGDGSNMAPLNMDGEPILPPQGPPVFTLAPLEESVQNVRVEVPVPQVQSEPQVEPQIQAEPEPQTELEQDTPIGGEVPLAGTPIPLEIGQRGVSGIVDFCYEGFDVNPSDLSTLVPPWSLIVANNEGGVFSADINNASIDASDWQRPNPPIC